MKVFFFYFPKPFHNNIFLCVKRPILKRSIFSRLLLIFRCNLYITVDFFLLDLECPKLQRNVFHFNWIIVFYLCFMFLSSELPLIAPSYSVARWTIQPTSPGVSLLAFALDFSEFLPDHCRLLWRTFLFCL